MSGMFSPSSGNAWVSGYSILGDISKVQELIGYCPQFDILWDELTVKEHLMFYTKLKNVKDSVADELVQQTLHDTNLKKFEDYLVKELSGGMKRRLSLGISLVGNPSLVFLDEPTTGLDPDNRRQIWEILSKCKQGKSMILTTHIMEEAEVLSNRIGIIVNGELKCIDTKYKLKRVYGKGYKLNINTYHSIVQPLFFEDLTVDSEESKTNRIINRIQERIPNSELRERYKCTLSYFISNEDFDAELIYSTISEMKENCDIESWTISQVSLEDIFIDLTEKHVYT